MKEEQKNTMEEADTYTQHESHQTWPMGRANESTDLRLSLVLRVKVLLTHLPYCFDERTS
jgi:hypothetical protein